MGVSPSNAKAADPSAARDSIGLPFGKLGIDKEGTILEIDFRVWNLTVETRWNSSMFECQYRLD
jgi:hypothetical protein